MMESEATTYRVYRRRWVQLLIYTLATFANAMHNMTFTSIQLQTSYFFDLTLLQVNASFIVFLFLYVVGTILAIWIYNAFSIRTGVLVGSILNLGVFIRLFALISPYQGYPALIIGQIFPAIAAPLFINITSLFSTRWFAPKQRDIATTISSMAYPLGFVAGAIIPSFVVTEDVSSTQYLILFLVEGGFTALTTVLIIVMFKSEPPSPPSQPLSSSSPSETNTLRSKIKDNLIKLIKNRHYLILLFSFAINISLFITVTTLLYQLVEPRGYSLSDAAVFGMINIIAGFIGAVVVGAIMVRTCAYRLILKILSVAACASIIYFILILQPDQFYPLAVSIGLMGFMLLPLIPVSYECAAECTFPISEEWSNGVLMCVGNLLAGIFIFILNALISLNPVSSSTIIITPATIFILCCSVISTLVILPYKGPYLRLEATREVNTESTVNI